MKWIETFESATKKYSLEDASDKAMSSPIGPKKLYFAFPKNNLEEFAFSIFTTLGIIPCLFRNMQEAIKEMKRIQSTGYKADELVIQTHGNANNLITTKDEGVIDRNLFLKWFLPNLKTIISKDSKVIFTSCQGADDLYGLKRAAEILGCRVYGSMGLYYPGRNYSEKGWYYCNPNTRMQGTHPLSNDDIIKRKHCVKCETPVSWIRWLVPEGH